MRQLIAKIVIALVVIVAATLPEITRAQTALETPEPQTRNEETPQVSPPGSYAELRTYLFIHDTSINMRKRKRIPIMQTSIRAVLDNIPSIAYAGLRAFGHRFPPDGPDG